MASNVWIGDSHSTENLMDCEKHNPCLCTVTLNPLGTVDRYGSSLRDATGPVDVSVVVETFPRPQYLLKFWNCQVHKNSNDLNFEIVRYIKIPTTEAIESNDLNIEN